MAALPQPATTVELYLAAVLEELRTLNEMLKQRAQPSTAPKPGPAKK